MQANVTTTVVINPDVYATEYGVEDSKVRDDAQGYLKDGVREILQERFSLLGWATVGEVHVSIHDGDAVTAQDSRHGLPTGFEHVHLADLVAIYRALVHVPAILIGGTWLRVQNEIEARRRNDFRAVTAAFEQDTALRKRLNVPPVA